MSKKTLCIAFILGVATFFLYTHFHEMKGQNAYLDSLTFSNTQTWDPFFMQRAEGARQTETILLPPPPSNSEKSTHKELKALHELTQKRTTEKIAEIKREIYLEDAYFGSSTFKEIVTKEKRPYTHALMQYVAEVEVAPIFVHKLHFNRVRPSKLDSSLTTVINAPDHPAYPSGHATQAYLRSFVLSALDEVHSERYSASAERISLNREIAGVHYRSDSEAGKVLARHIYTTLSADQTFKALFVQAQTEW